MNNGHNTNSIDTVSGSYNAIIRKNTKIETKLQNALKRENIHCSFFKRFRY